MSVELYPDHKSILHFQNSLKVYEIDFLEYLTAFLSQDKYGQRHFDLYVKPTLHHSAFDFIVVEPHHKMYVIQTPVSVEEYQAGIETLDAFYEQRLQTLSPTLNENIQKSARGKDVLKQALIKQIFYVYDKRLLDTFRDEEEAFITAEDFQENSNLLEEVFKQQTNSNFRLTRNESAEIKEVLNPNTNFKRYIPKSLPSDYQEYVKSHTQTKQKFKGPSGFGKTIVLAKRAINCSNRLKDQGRILVIAGNEENVPLLKDLITAEATRPLQELGIDVYRYQELVPKAEKYRALFIDDAQCLEPAAFEDLLDNYLVTMNEENDYEYIVMADDQSLPKVPQIFGPYRTLKVNLQRMTKLLRDSRDVFLEILNA